MYGIIHVDLIKVPSAGHEPQARALVFKTNSKSLANCFMDLIIHSELHSGKSYS
jgi:hypothetical protein